MTILIQMPLSSAGPPDPNRAISPTRLGLGATLGRLPPSALLLLAILSIQLSSAIATFLFSSLGPAGTALLATAFSAAALTLASPPRIDSRLRNSAGLILLFGLAQACMVLPFFLALQRIPLGIASAIAFLGPLGLAAATSRRLFHFLWISVAALGVALLTPQIGSDLDPIGLAIAGVAAAAWAAFVPLSKRLGRAFEGNDGLTLGLWAGSLMLLPFGLAEASLFHAGAIEIVGALVVALMNSLLPNILEFRALQRMSARTYGVLVTLEPAIGALVGAALLGQGLGLRTSAAIACITVAALGLTLSERPRI
jgi:inner membrane transporter RhtA